MTSRPVLTIAFVSIILAACSGGESDDAGATLPEITLITSPPDDPLFEEVEGESGPSAAAESTVPETEVSVTVEEPAVTETDVPETEAPETETPETVATTAAPVVETTVEPATPPAGGDFVLGPDGLGTIPFGADPEQTITFVSSVFGAPTGDTGWVDPFEIGVCGGTRIRQVNWNQLQLEFGDVSNVIQGRDHFYAYFYGAADSSTPQPAGLATAENVGPGSSVAALLAAYPGATLRLGDEIIGPSFSINDNLAGRMSGITDVDSVQALIGGIPCDG